MQKETGNAGADNARIIKAYVQQHGRYIASLPVSSAGRTIKALKADGYGVELVARTESGTELWRVFGE